MLKSDAMCLLGCLEQFWAADAVAVGWLWLD